MPRKKVLKEEKKTRTISLPISKLIDTKFRDYAVYVLESRGIPSFYDALTPVQRYILMNSPASFNKTLSVVGKSIQDGYHHGDCIFPDTKINLSGGGQIEIKKWADHFSEESFLLRSIDEKTGKEKVGVGHSPRIGHTTDEYYEIEMENGEVFKCTPNHPFYVDGKWIESKDLEDGMDIQNLE
jgi:hypothetical protein